MTSRRCSIPSDRRLESALLREKGYVTARWVASIRLVAALLIVVGLAVSVPPSFGTAGADHFGLLLHPLFPHVHGSGTSIFMPDDVLTVTNDRALPSDDVGWTAFDQAPGVRGQVADDGFRSVLSGIVLPTLLAGALLQLSQIRLAVARLAHQDWRGPPAPPPRATPVVVTR
jgi:hypothetical protein